MRSCKLLLLAMAFCCLQNAIAQHMSLSGIVKGSDKQVISYAYVMIRELDLTIATDEHGAFTFTSLQKGQYTLDVLASGYKPHSQKVLLNTSKKLSIVLDLKSLRLKEVLVMARRRKYKSGTRTIHKEAMEHIQPSSLGDVFQLLPGHLTKDGNMTSVNQIASRQVGSDRNTALGTAIYTNGVPMSNDATLHRVMGDQGQRNRNTVNGGVDLRLISTDHLEQVDVMQGIPSAKYGNLTSGLVVTRTKAGASPYSLRIKADPNTKLVYLGKGFKFPKGGGSLYLGADYTYSQPNVRETLANFSRYSTIANYTNNLAIASSSLSYGLQVSYVGTLDGKKSDQDLDEIINDYRDEYNRISLSHNGTLNLSSPWIKSLEWNLACSYANDYAIRDMVVSTGGTTPLALSKEEGEFEGTFLPVEYVTKYTLDDKPINLYFSFSGKSLYGTEGLRGFLDWGMDYSYDRNIGEGYQYDINRPPFPTMPMSSRPRAFKVLPAYQRLSSFVENNLHWTIGEHRLRLKTGFRFSGMPNVNAKYEALNHKVFFEPRMNLTYRLPSFKLLGKENKLSFRLGYGRGVKYPTLDLLEPSVFYRDIKSCVNFNPNKPKDNYLLITTKKEEARNYSLRPNINDKYELELIYNFGDIRFELLGFYEEDKAGFVYAPRFQNLSYNKYKYKHQAGALHDKSQFLKKSVSKLYQYQVPENGELVRKTGLEYSLSIPKIEAIQTSIEINGAYYLTYYDISRPIMKQPDVRLNNKDYPFVAYYGHDRANYKSMFNTNIWFNTHIPYYGLVFTTKFQFIWFDKYADRWYDGIPEYYFGSDMKKRPFRQEDVNDNTLRYLVLSKPNIFFTPSYTPFRASLDLKVSKDISKLCRISFFVNRLGFFSPRYKDKFGIIDKIRRGPYFGSEINIKI